jgi:hypothetical protein
MLPGGPVPGHITEISPEKNFFEEICGLESGLIPLMQNKTCIVSILYKNNIDILVQNSLVQIRKQFFSKEKFQKIALL